MSLLILSGGLDSAAALWDNLGDITQCLTFNYGQRHVKELDSARKLVTTASTEKGETILHNIIDLTSAFACVKSGSLAGDDPIPEGHYAAESMKSTVVPNRNLIMLSIASAWAIANDLGPVIYAAHAGDHAIYPDCRPEFATAVALAIRTSNSTINANVLMAPFMYKTKADIVKLGVELGVPFSLTWSCYNGRDLACGKCGTCVERLEAFNITATEDPLPYEDREWWKGQVKA